MLLAGFLLASALPAFATEETTEPAEPPHEHSYTIIKTVVEPTCTERGYTMRYCECGECEGTVNTYLDPLGHAYGAVQTKLPTCTEHAVEYTHGWGYDYQVCTRPGCHDVFIVPNTYTAPHYYKLDVTGIESEHTYQNATTQEWTLECTEEDATGLTLTFDIRTELENQYDFLYVIDGNGNLLTRYTGTELAGKTIRIHTPKVTLRLVSDEKNNDWGFKVTDAHGTAHHWDNGTIIVHPGVEDGWKQYTCPVCGDTYNEVLPATLKDEGVSSNYHWTLSLDNTLTLSVKDPDDDTEPVHWSKYKDTIQHLVVEDGVTTIGSSAFSDFTSLQDAVLADSITSMGTNVFNNCTSLRSVKLPSGLKEVPDYTFCYCSALTDVVIPEGVTTIGNNAFKYCTTLRSLCLPDGLTTIKYAAFYQNGSLREISLPASIRTIEGNAFFGAFCRKVTLRMDVDARPNDWYDVWLNISFSNDDSNPLGNSDLYVNDRKITEIKIPGHFDRLPAYAFAGCASVETLLLPANLTTIGDSAMRGCYNLREVVYVKSEDTPNKLETIGQYAFADSGLRYLEIPDTVKTVGLSAFASYKIKSVVFLGNPPEYSGNPFDSSTYAFYSESAQEAWEASDLKTQCTNVRWMSYAPDTNIIASGTYTDATINWTLDRFGTLRITGSGTIPRTTSFYTPTWDQYKSLIRSVVIEDGIQGIDESAFQSLSMESVTIPASVTSIYKDAFANCHELETVTFLGSAPDYFSRDAFSGVTATVYLQHPDTTWTEAKRQNYGGNLTWCIADHEHTYQDTVTPPTCTEDGYTTHACTICGESSVDTPIPATGHTYQETVFAPTCTQRGYTADVCQICGDQSVREDSYVDALGHDLITDVYEATCTKQGYKQDRCNLCDYISEQYDIQQPNDNHYWYQTAVNAYPSCTTEGSCDYRCIHCRITKTETVPALGHSEQKTVTKPTCETPGYTVVTCSRCKDARVEDYVDPTGHSWEVDTAQCVAATCGSTGVLVQCCATCGQTTQAVLPANGNHVWDEGTVVEEATGLQDGVMEYHCTVCGQTRQEAIPSTVIMGDVDCNGKVELVDALMLLQAVAGKRTLDEGQMLRADLNADGELAVEEALKVLRYVNGSATSVV